MVVGCMIIIIIIGATSIAIGDFKIGGEEALSRAFSGADAIFILCPIGILISYE